MWAAGRYGVVITSRLCSAHLQVSVSPSSTIKIGFPSRAVTFVTMVNIYYKIELYFLHLLERVHALGEDVVPHDAHNDGHLGNGNVSFKGHTQTIHY